MSICPSVRPHGTTRLPPDEFSWNLILEFLQNICRENLRSIKIWQENRVPELTHTHTRTRARAHTHTHIYYMSLNFVRIRNSSDKSCRENPQNKHFMLNNFFFKSCRLWDNVVKYCRAGQTTDDIWRMRTACWIPKATNASSQSVTIIAFPLQQWLRESTSMLCHAYILTALY
jgi:hypothetical protein